MKLRNLMSQVICSLCSFGAAWAGYHLWFLARGYSPIEIAEPNVWLARGEFLFAAAIALLGLWGYVMLIIERRKGRCPLCGKQLDQDTHQDKPDETVKGVKHAQED